MKMEYVVDLLFVSYFVCSSINGYINTIVEYISVKITCLNKGQYDAEYPTE